ncbi:MAG TPA: hypothetical protein VGI45_03430 [Terracidiphilus sp.]|jgi:hypothetical protein
MDIEHAHRRLRSIGKCAAFGVLFVLASTIPIFAGATDKPVESIHVSGPNGLQGWTLSWPVPDSGYGDEPFAFTLVLARNGKVLHRIDGDPIIWKWMFWAGGSQVAYETGPFHFSETCVLVEVSTGRRLQAFDCYHELPAKVPDWVTALKP